MNNILIDSDVLLDFFYDRKPFSESASKVLTNCESGVIKGHITPVIVSNCYYLLRKTAKHETVITKLKQLLSFIDVLDMSHRNVLAALDSSFKDFEDALQYHTALQSYAVDVILTRNLKDYKKSIIPVMTPETYAKSVRL